MGRIKTKMIKRVTLELVEKNESILSKDFDENKKILANVAEFRSKKLRNVVAGYTSRLMKKKEADRV